MLATLCKDGTLRADFVLQKAGEEPFKTPEDIVSGARPEGTTEGSTPESQPLPAGEEHAPEVVPPSGDLPPDGAVPAPPTDVQVAPPVK
jgi:hypothetical protein